MARDPNERVGPGQDLEKAEDFKGLGIAVPSGFVIGTSTGQYYAHYNVHADGHTTVEWYKRGAGGGPGKPDPIELVTPGVPAKDIKDEWDKGNAKPANVYVGTNPTTGKPSQVSESPDGTKTYDDTQVPASASGAPPGGKPYLDEEGPSGRRLGWNPATGQYDRDLGSSPSAQAAAAGASDTKPLEGHPGWSVRTSKVGGDTRTVYINPQGQEAPEPPKPGQIIPGTTAPGAQYTGILNPTTGEITWTDNPNAIPPKDQRWVFKRGTDGTVSRENNPYYDKPSKLVQDPSDPRKWIELTEDDNGQPVVKPVTNQTTIKPADLPVLQSKYGDIAQGLGRLAQELNQRVARQEMTPQERTEAFTAAYKQAETQVSEINSILDNSKAIWSGQVSQRRDTLGETQSRRSFASDAAGRAITTGYTIATSAGPGHGKQIAAGVEALMGMQERYAQGMGGFRESPEIGLPPALEQARGIGLPGSGALSGVERGESRGMPAAGPPGVPQAAPQMSGSGPPGVPPPGPPNALGPGAIGALEAPGGPPETPARPQPLLPPPPPVTGPMTSPGASPVAGMGAALQGAQSYAGAPVAAGGAGMWDPMHAMQGMLGQGGDAAWEEAVRRAAGAFGRFRG